jgi:GT2 family glycosyltransferase
MSVLAVVPACLRDRHDAELLGRCLVSLWSTAPGLPAIVVDAGRSDELAPVCAELGYELLRLDGRASFARAANAGLAIAEGVGADAVVVHHDVELIEPGWLDALAEARGDVAGSRLLFPDGTLEHCGYQYSQLHGQFVARMRFGPADLPASLEPAVCPVGAALTLIRHDALVALGGFDESSAEADVDLCLRAFAAGGECVYEPRAVALHHGIAWSGHAPARSAGELDDALIRRFA